MSDSEFIRSTWSPDTADTLPGMSCNRSVTRRAVTRMSPIWSLLGSVAASAGGVVCPVARRSVCGVVVV